jgi:hypothetical protein
MVSGRTLNRAATAALGQGVVVVQDGSQLPV